MNFLHLDYLPGLLLAIVVFSFSVFFLEKRFFRLVKSYWFFNRSIFSYLSTGLLVLGMSTLVLSLLDVRGPEEKIKTEVSTDRTIILIDTSASMLAEDVKPSRLQKAALIAKHFARKAVGQQISIVAFAEIQKKIVPFTSDLDLIDARLDSLKNLRNHYGSSALTVAIQESIQYFLEAGGEARGNILILTDGEETADGIDLKVPKDIHVALVGVGTSQGGRIPLDDGRGFRFGYKKDKGQDIITKLHEEFFKKISSDIPSAKYWMANSYSLPSDEVLEFFQKEKVRGQGQQDMVIRPVLAEWLIVPAIVILILSYLFKMIRVFTLGLLLIGITHGWSQDEQKPVELSKEMIARMNQLQNGSLGQLEKLKLADDLYKSGLKEEALTLYKENLDLKKIDPNLPAEAYLNYGTGQLETGDNQGGLDTYSKLLNSSTGKRLKDTIEKNIVTHFKQQAEKKEQEKKDKENKDKNQDKNKDQNKGQGQGQDQKGQGQQQNPGKDEGKDQQDKKDKGQQKDKDKEKGDNNNEDNNEDNKDDQKDKDKPEDQKQGDTKPMPPKKVTAKLKQLMSDDRQLQLKMIENGTRDLNKRQNRKSKDW